MVLGWRIAFCTSISKDHKSDPDQSPRIRTRFGGFFSNPSTPRLPSSDQTVCASSMIRCTTTTAALQEEPRPTRLLIFPHSAPSSPRSPSTFSLFRSSLRLTKSRCGVCFHSVKTGDGTTAIFTAECGHSFHFPCISSHVKKQGSPVCPVCTSAWKQINLSSTLQIKLKVYDDDEPLSSPTSGARFIPIPESDETEEANEEFSVISSNMKFLNEKKSRNLEISLLPEAAVVSVGKSSEIIAVILKIKAPVAPPRRAPVDLVAVLDVSRSITSEKLHLMKRAMRLVVSSLSASDRLSIVAFSATSKRLLPLRRMTVSGKKSALRIIDAAIALDWHATAASDSLKKAAKVIEDRRQKNPAAAILQFADGHRSDPLASSSKDSQMKIPVHSFSVSACVHAPPDSLSNCINGVLSAAGVQELEIQLGSAPGSASDDIRAVYSCTGRPEMIGSRSNWFPVGDFHSEEEKELLLELKLPSPFSGTHRFLSVRCSYKDPSTQQRVHDKERSIVVPGARSSSRRQIQRLKCLFITARAIAESRILVARSDIAGAHHMLASARSLVIKSGEEFVRRLEAELSELALKRQEPRKNHRGRETSVLWDERAEPYTPTSAWRAAERLAKVAIMKKSLNRVSDLHGFENARF